MEKKARFSLAGLIVTVLCFAVLIAIMIPTINRSSTNWSTIGCASNLRSLMQSQFNYAAQYGRPNGLMPTETGSDFWLKLQRTPKPLIERYEPFFFPLSGDEVGPGKTSYRGPAFNINKMEPGDIYAADKEGNHGPGRGGNVLTKTGDVREVEETDPLWLRAGVTTQP